MTHPVRSVITLFTSPARTLGLKLETCLNARVEQKRLSLINMYSSSVRQAGANTTFNKTNGQSFPADLIREFYLVPVTASLLRTARSFSFTADPFRILMVFWIASNPSPNNGGHRLTEVHSSQLYNLSEFGQVAVYLFGQMSRTETQVF